MKLLKSELLVLKDCIVENLNHAFGFLEQTLELEVVTNILHARVETGLNMKIVNGFLTNALQMDQLVWPLLYVQKLTQKEDVNLGMIKSAFKLLHHLIQLNHLFAKPTLHVLMHSIRLTPIVKMPIANVQLMV